jgi:hypothetical protein
MRNPRAATGGVGSAVALALGNADERAPQIAVQPRLGSRRTQIGSPKHLIACVSFAATAVPSSLLMTIAMPAGSACGLNERSRTKPRARRAPCQRFPVRGTADGRGRSHSPSRLAVGGRLLWLLKRSPAWRQVDLRGRPSPYSRRSRAVRRPAPSATPSDWGRPYRRQWELTYSTASAVFRRRVELLRRT